MHWGKKLDSPALLHLQSPRGIWLPVDAKGIYVLNAFHNRYAEVLKLNWIECCPQKTDWGYPKCINPASDTVGIVVFYIPVIIFIDK